MIYSCSPCIRPQKSHWVISRDKVNQISPGVINDKFFYLAIMERKSLEALPNKIVEDSRHGGYSSIKAQMVMALSHCTSILGIAVSRIEEAALVKLACDGGHDHC